jgi:BirA family biotin operon repressor/biotin-[acetyl-CoA-carboxylase] ligase
MNSLLKILCDGRFHSGEELGRLLGISRAAVWKQIQKIEQMGLDVKSHRGCGYCLMTELELFDKNTLLHSISPISWSLIKELRIEPSSKQRVVDGGEGSGSALLAGISISPWGGGLTAVCRCSKV